MRDAAEFNLSEIIAHIDQMQADAARERKETRLALWALVLSGATTGAALFAAGATFMKFFSR